MAKFGGEYRFSQTPPVVHEGDTRVLREAGEDREGIQARNEFFSRVKMFPLMRFEASAESSDAYLHRLHQVIEKELDKMSEEMLSVPSLIDSRFGDTREQSREVAACLRETARVLFLHHAVRDSLHTFGMVAERTVGKISLESKRKAEYLLSTVVQAYQALKEHILRATEVMGRNKLRDLPVMEHTTLAECLLRQGDVMAWQSLFVTEHDQYAEALWTNAFYQLRGEMHQLDFFGREGKRAEVALRGLVRHAPGILKALHQRSQGAVPADDTLKPTATTIEATLPYEDALTRTGKARYVGSDVVIGTGSAIEDLPSHFRGVQVKHMKENVLQDEDARPYLHMNNQDVQLWDELCELFDRYVEPTEGSTHNTTPVPEGFTDRVQDLNKTYNDMMGRFARGTNLQPSALAGVDDNFLRDVYSRLDIFKASDINLLVSKVVSYGSFRSFFVPFLERDDVKKYLSILDEVGGVAQLQRIVRDAHAFSNSKIGPKLEALIRSQPTHPLWMAMWQNISTEERRARNKAVKKIKDATSMAVKSANNRKRGL